MDTVKVSCYRIYGSYGTHPTCGGRDNEDVPPCIFFKLYLGRIVKIPGPEGEEKHMLKGDGVCTRDPNKWLEVSLGEVCMHHPDYEYWKSCRHKYLAGFGELEESDDS
jgi:hypothetical protein